MYGSLWPILGSVGKCSPSYPSTLAEASSDKLASAALAMLCRRSATKTRPKAELAREAGQSGDKLEKRAVAGVVPAVVTA